MATCDHGLLFLSASGDYSHPLFAYRGWNDDFSPFAGFETPPLERQYAKVVQLLCSGLYDYNVGHSSRGQVNVQPIQSIAFNLFPLYVLPIL